MIKVNKFLFNPLFLFLNVLEDGEYWFQKRQKAQLSVLCTDVYEVMWSLMRLFLSFHFIFSTVHLALKKTKTKKKMLGPTKCMLHCCYLDISAIQCKTSSKPFQQM